MMARLRAKLMKSFSSGADVWLPLPVQQTADQLLARADAAKALAEEAAKKGRSTFREAESILDDLRGTNPPVCLPVCLICSVLGYFVILRFSRF